MERVDILIFLRRILGVLNTSIGTRQKKLRMLADIRMVGRGLKRDVERDLDPMLRRDRDELLEVVDRAKVGVNGFVPAGFSADRPRRSDVPLVGADLVVLSF